MNCVNCGSEIAPGAKFCQNCGRAVADGPTPITVSPAEPPAQATESSAEKKAAVEPTSSSRAKVPLTRRLVAMSIRTIVTIAIAISIGKMLEYLFHGADEFFAAADA